MNNPKYWRRRSVKLGLLTERKAQRTARAVLDAYNRTLDNIQNRISRIFARFVHNNDSLNAEKANRLLSARETQKYRQELLVLYHSTTDKGVRDELRAMLEAPAYANRISGLNALRDIVRADCVMLGRLEKELVGNGLADALHEAYTRQVYDIQQGTGYGRRIKTLEDKQVRAILGQKWKGNNFSGRIWNNNQAFADAVEQTLLAGTLGGLRFSEMRDMLLQITGEDASSGAKANAMRLIRTEFCHVAAQGTLLGYQSAGIEWYRYVATLDLRTSQVCRELDLKRFQVDKARAGVNFPPMHPNCRSTTMPDVDAATLAKIKRAARDPVTGKSITVPGDMSYADWYQQFVQGAHDDSGAKASDAKTGLKQQKQRTVSYVSNALAGKESGSALRGVAYKKEADPIREVLGPIRVSHPEEIERIKSSAKSKGVEIVEGKGSMAYAPGLSRGSAGQLHLSENDSYGAWLHEEQHMLDDEADGWPGFAGLMDIDRRCRMEYNAYRKEIALARRVGRPDVVKKLKTLYMEEIKKIGGEPIDFD